jgi:hypothetical protein
MRDEIFKALEARWHELYDQYEAAYRLLRQVKVLTNSRNPALRFFFLGLALVLQNIWVLARWLFHVAQQRTAQAHPLTAPFCTLLQVTRARCGALLSTPIGGFRIRFTSIRESLNFQTYLFIVYK